MKILILLHQVMDLGGIINHTEQLIGGLKDLGHEVHFKELTWKEVGVGKKGEIGYGFRIGPSGVPHHQGKGWHFSREDRIGYRGGLSLLGWERWIKSMNFDMVVWTVPVPSVAKANAGNSDWLALYDLPTKIKQVAFIHDGNAGRSYTHIMRIQEHLSGLACVHPCALNSSGYLDTPRALVVNPQENPVREFPAWENKRPGFVNMQTFKAWKHVHELVQAIPYMPEKHPDELREIAGKGIEYQYMTSEEKCKPHYFHPDGGEWFSGMKIWEAALGHGMTHHEYWQVDQVDEILQSARVLVDPSWSNRYSEDGGHFNRVVVDAMIRGAIPVARTLGMGTELFKPGQHYIEIPRDADPEEYAETVIAAGELHPKIARELIAHGQELLPMFDRKVVAQRLIDLAFGNIETYGKSRESKKQKAICDMTMFERFGSL